MTMTNMLETIDIFDVPVTVLNSYDDTVAYIIDRIRQRQKTFCVSINPEKTYCAQYDVKIKKLIRRADIHICDGIGIVIAAKILYDRKIPRITGIQLFLDLMARAEKEGLKVFLLGATPESNRSACEKLLAKHPKLKIVGSHHGYLNNGSMVARIINESGADMLFVSMGSPKQEYWISRHMESINASFIMGIGGTLDVVSGKAKWAPKLFRKTGTEFLYRLICEPKRLKRQICYPVFMLQVIKARLFGSDRCLLK